ncbi:helix-turn-helix domain-containing protein [Spirochaeta isovalerica]|uniref:AraC-like DNA-binding protein/quercetin dioxygenase-like cupin family protein n=1 Tax=Spirochaeta isovalerica TaxID=150 RepID=A0A841RE50_9SPIO|nr:AraC family transcriptional regulator [Spirochaeta isovalerica]MBB6481119.1 AraC-like DNA-binding protein/quercetin dioxygenase-like cupin family protein [Spirochaeta isovalerica]
MYPISDIELVDMEIQGFFSTPVKEEIRIEEIFTIHYFEYTKDFYFGGEKHDFWEFLYVDGGVVEVVAGKTQHTLFKGDIIFHRPGEFHSLWANGKTAPNLVVITFSSSSVVMKWFIGKILRIKGEERNLLGSIIHEAQRTFSTRLDDPATKGMIKREEVPFGCEHMIKLHLEELLIRLIRRDSDVSGPDRLTGTIEQRTKEVAFNKVVNFMEDNLASSFEICDLCRSVGYSRSYLHRIFKERTGQSVMEYYKRVKIERVKQMIREGSNNFTQICDELDFTSLQHFSRVFKRYVGMTPSEYSQSVKLKSGFAPGKN